MCTFGRLKLTNQWLFMDMAAENTPYLTNTLLLNDGETPHLSLWEEEEEKEEEKEEEEGVDEDEDEEDDQY